MDSHSQSRMAVVPLPAEIDITNASEAGSDLLAAFALAPGVTAVIADMTATTLCDSAGMEMLALVRAEAVLRHVKLILVVPTAAVLHGLTEAGLLALLPVYPSLPEALASESAPHNGADS